MQKGVQVPTKTNIVTKRRQMTPKNAQVVNLGGIKSKKNLIPFSLKKQASEKVRCQKSVIFGH